jgi:(2Fe-2S) ferredoxin
VLNIITPVTGFRIYANYRHNLKIDLRRPAMQKPETHIFICASTRLNGIVKGSCQNKSSHNLVAMFSEEVMDRDLEGEVMVTATGCVGLCEKGPVVMIYPQQIWYGEVTEDDIEDILDAIEEGGVVDRLAIS